MNKPANTRVNGFAALLYPFHAEVDGKPVRCVAFGDVEGNSPSYLIVDQEGHSSWQSLADIIVTDSNFLPLAGAGRSKITSNNPQTRNK